MSKEEVDKKFWDRADEIIHLANDQCDNTPYGEVSSSLLYAAARFNSFIIASSAKDVEEMKKDKEEAVKYFTAQYRNMFIENFDDYIENYKENIRR